ncbi:GSCOCT00006886001.3-RA-CDS [Cotesia congregata]|uniref:Gustatory receptor n=1 Tax=Cotesia congregata TaxID=51543 RepID=A0A8J2HC78_COTCN|nr:GSCOCT00006886001.3-RA-CDS [Cotesia congregata]CAG5089512.1 gustatory receptor 38 [Cotesia congregata]
MNYQKIKSVCYRLSVVSQYFFFKLIGLSPWSIDASEIICRNRRIESHNFKCSFSYVGICYNLLFITVTLIVYNILYIFYSSLISGLEHARTFEVPFSFLSMLCVISIIVIYMIRQKLLINLINNRLQMVDKNLSSCADYDIKYDYTNDLIFYTNLFFISSILLALQLYRKSVPIIIFMNLPNFLIIWPLIHYLMFINMIKLRFEGINSTLLKLGTYESKILRSRELVLNDISSLKRAYVEICKGCDDIVSFFGIPVFIVIFIQSVRSVRNLYFITIELITSLKIKFIICFAISGVLHTTILFILLTTAVTKVIKQNKETLRIINLLRDRFYMDEEIFENLLKFSSHLTYLTVEFTCCDIIPLDRTFLAMIYGTTATYLVIAVQFYINAVTH